jgi:hypothetical protein
MGRSGPAYLGIDHEAAIGGDIDHNVVAASHRFVVVASVGNDGGRAGGRGLLARVRLDIPQQLAAQPRQIFALQPFDAPAVNTARDRVRSNERCTGPREYTAELYSRRELGECD